MAFYIVAEYADHNGNDGKKLSECIGNRAQKRIVDGEKTCPEKLYDYDITLTFIFRK